MTLSERGRLGNASLADRAVARRLAFLPYLRTTRGLKRAAWRAGVPVRTAGRYKARLRSEGLL